MQRTKDKLAGVHRESAILALPVAPRQGQAASAEVEIGHRPVRSLQAGIGDFKAANLQRGQSSQRGEEIGQGFIALQTNVVQAQAIDNPAPVGGAAGRTGERSTRHICANSA